MNGNNMNRFEEHTNIARSFWTSKNIYPEYGTIKQRRIYELNFLVPQLSGKSILDLGCGDGALINCLFHLTDFDQYYAFDWSESLINGVNKNISTRVYDCNDPSDLPKTDIIIFAGVLPFIFDDSNVLKLFDYFKAKQIFLRAPCTLNNEREIIKTYSEQLKEEYSSVYRTVKEVENLISSKFNLKNTVRIYPDEIESKFGTRQFYFIIENKK